MTNIERILPPSPLFSSLHILMTVLMDVTRMANYATEDKQARSQMICRLQIIDNFRLRVIME